MNNLYSTKHLYVFIAFVHWKVGVQKCFYLTRMLINFQGLHIGNEVTKGPFKTIRVGWPKQLVSVEWHCGWIGNLNKVQVLCRITTIS